MSKNVNSDMCQVCGKVEGKWVNDPYSDEVYDQQVLTCLCDECYQESIWDI